MYKTILAALILSIFQVSAYAREDVISINISETFESLAIESQLDGVKMYFGDQTYPAATKEMSIIRTNRKTNAFNKSDRQACEWVFLSAIMALKDSALSNGGNAVVNIKSNYNNIEYSSPDQYKCGVGRIIAGVALIGQVASIPENSSLKTKPVNKETTGCTTKQVQDMKNIGLSSEQITSACG